MFNVGSFVILTGKEYQQIRDTLVRVQKAVELAHKLTGEEIDDVLAGRKHLHANPQRKVKQQTQEVES